MQECLPVSKRLRSFPVRGIKNFAVLVVLVVRSSAIEVYFQTVCVDNYKLKKKVKVRTLC